MRLYTDREKVLAEMCRPYYAKNRPGLVESAPPKIKKAFEEFLEIGKEEDAKYAALM